MGSPPAICADGDCKLAVRRRVNGTGWCNKHGKRVQRYGSPDVVKCVSSYEGQECSVDGCTARPRRGGLCPPHSEQKRTHGDPTVWVRASPGAGTMRKDGYRQITAHGHPLADKYGHVLEHRKILFDTIGPGPHPCYGCGTPVDWEAGITATSIIADHLDFNPANNAPANLVPSCNPCNVRRTQLSSDERKARSAVARAARGH